MLWTAIHNPGDKSVRINYTLHGTRTHDAHTYNVGLYAQCDVY